MANSERPQFFIRFWGVRGSYPTPGPHTLRHGGNTACVEIRVGQHILIFDAGSGIIGLGARLMQLADQLSSFHIALFVTHGHGDHLVGFPFFAPLFDARTHIHMFGPRLDGRGIEELLTPLMSPPYFPVDVRQLPSTRIFHTLGHNASVIWNGDEQSPIISEHTRSAAIRDGEVQVSAKFMQCHPLNGSIVYRVEYAGHSLVYATDIEWRDGYEQDFLDFIRNADVLIHDAQYTTSDYQGLKQGYGHSTVAMATDVAAAAQVGELILFHHEPVYNDDQLDIMETEARTRFHRTRSAWEGMEINLLA
ncbi:MAG TPA: MBL fold metallo-hydrolase [Dictyobacter sp.]|jgi:phosphoribosyl 1,2-cyclic phosphodiesterase|nr:MBL fold metallo-hydrolase [Dictyobacter sp.]